MLEGDGFLGTFLDAQVALDAFREKERDYDAGLIQWYYEKQASWAHIQTDAAVHGIAALILADLNLHRMDSLPDVLKGWELSPLLQDDSFFRASCATYTAPVASLQVDGASFHCRGVKHRAELALAQIQLAQGERDAAIETLKSAIARDPGSLEAERAKEILAQYGTEYIPPIDPDITLAALKSSFGRTLVPAFAGGEKAISVQLNARGSKFSYGSNFSASIAITNNSSEPLVISDDGLLKGNIRIDANITGDLNKKIPKLVSLKIRPALPVKPGQSIVIPVRLVTAELRQLLLTYPQASVDIEFTLYLDPVITEQSVTNSLTDIEPAKLLINRQGVNLTAKYLRNRFSSLTKGRQGQKIKTAQLFTGLLAEQNAMANREPLYKFMYADWMPAMLKSALLHNLTDDDWVAKVHTMTGMLSLPLDYELTEALAENLNDTHWPVRMMAIYLLTKNQDSNFAKVLDWTVKYDSNKFVRDMAIALGATIPEQKEQPEPVIDEPAQPLPETSPSTAP